MHENTSVMRQSITFRSVAVVAAVSAAPPVSAQASGKWADRDPNEQVCETQGQLGTRLATKKVCATRAEWALRKAADRQSVDDMQRIGNMPCVPVDIPSDGATPC